MKYLLLICIMGLGNVLLAQDSGTDTSKKTKKYLYYVDRQKDRDVKLGRFADSINLYKGGKIPSFLLNPCFDSNNNIPAISFHSTVSNRWTILENVTNKRALELILGSINKKLKEICSNNIDPKSKHQIDFLDQSFYDLIKKRLKQL